MGKILKGIISVMFSSISAIIVSIIYQPLLARLAGINLYGEIATVLAWYVILQTIFSFGMFDAVRKYVSDKINKKNNDVIIISIIIPLLIALIFYLIMFILMTLFRYLNFINKNYIIFLIVGISLIFSNVWISVKGILYSYHKENYAEVYNVMSKIIQSIIVILFVFYDYGIYSIAYALLITGLAKFIFSIILWKKHINVNFDIPNFFDEKNKKLMCKIFKFGLMSIPGILSAKLLYKSDILLINYFLGSGPAGIYKVALTLAEKLWLLPKAVQGIIFHNSSELWGQNKYKELTNVFNKSLKYTNLFLILLGIGLFVLANPFISIVFGNDFVNAVIPLRILIIGTFGFGVARIFMSIFSATAWLKVTQIITIFVAITNVVLNYIMIPLYNINGAAIATSFTYFLMLLFSLIYYYNNDLKFKVEFELFKMIGLTISFLICFYMLYLIMPELTIITIILTSFMGLMLFLIIAYIFKLLTKKEYLYIKNLLIN